MKESRHRLQSMPAEERRTSYVEYEIPYSRSEAVAESTRCLQCTCEAIGFCDLRRLGIEYGTTLKTLEPARTGAGYRSVTENRFTGYNHDYIRDDSHAFILREPSRCIDCGRCANVCAEVVGAACYDFMRIGFDTLVTTPLDMSLNDTPCVSCGRCAETCPTGALMPKPRILEKYEVDESRCILCGICVDACPYDALRCGPDFELAHTSREEPMIDLIAIAAVDRETEMTYIRRERDWAERARASGRDIGPRMLPVLPASIADGNGGGTATRHPLPSAPTERGDRCRFPIPSRSWGSAGTTCCSWSSPAAMLGTALLVVTLRDIIRGGLALIAAFGALAGIYVLLGAPLVAGRPGARLHRRDRRPHPVRRHADPGQERAGAPRLPDPGDPGGDRRGRSWPS